MRSSDGARRRKRCAAQGQRHVQHTPLRTLCVFLLLARLQGITSGKAKEGGAGTCRRNNTGGPAGGQQHWGNGTIVIVLHLIPHKLREPSRRYTKFPTQAVSKACVHVMDTCRELSLQIPTQACCNHVISLCTGGIQNEVYMYMYKVMQSQRRPACWATRRA